MARRINGNPQVKPGQCVENLKVTVPNFFIDQNIKEAMNALQASLPFINSRGALISWIFERWWLVEGSRTHGKHIQQALGALNLPPLTEPPTASHDDRAQKP